jgi:hypothetical protein
VAVEVGGAAVVDVVGSGAGAVVGVVDGGGAGLVVARQNTTET